MEMRTMMRQGLSVEGVVSAGRGVEVGDEL